MKGEYLVWLNPKMDSLTKKQTNTVPEERDKTSDSTVKQEAKARRAKKEETEPDGEGMETLGTKWRLKGKEKRNAKPKVMKKLRG